MAPGPRLSPARRGAVEGVVREGFGVAWSKLTGAYRRSVAAAALISDEDGRVLLVENAFPRRRWGLPGGRLERGEEARAGLVREVREETGLEVEAGELLAVVLRPRVVVFVFGATILGGEIRPAPVEIAQVVWLAEAEAHRRLAPSARRHLEAARAGGTAGYLWDPATRRS
jgi:ADP-ribose pyrophosphatase YjhB (NUDIX family)